MYREDYARAGIVMLPVVEPEGLRTGQQIVIWALLLLPVSLMPTALGTSGSVYFFGAIVLGLLYMRAASSPPRRSRGRNARRVLLASVLYLPVLLGLMVLNM